MGVVKRSAMVSCVVTRVTAVTTDRQPLSKKECKEIQNMIGRRAIGLRAHFNVTGLHAVKKLQIKHNHSLRHCTGN